MRKIILLVVFVMISVLFATGAIAQTVPNKNQPPPRTAIGTSTNQQPSGMQQMQRPGSGPNTAPQGMQENPGTNSGMMPERPLGNQSGKPLGNGQSGSASGNMQQKCQTVEKVIADQSQKGTAMLVKIYQQLTSIFTGVQNYYTQKLVPNGVTLQNNSDLVATVQASQSALLAAIQTAQQDAKNFSCKGNQPGQQVSQFRTAMQSAIKAAIAYRDALKNYVEEVLQAAQNITETTNTTATNSAQ